MMKRYTVEYKDRVWTVEAILSLDTDNARVRIGRINEEGQYEWDLVFEKDLMIFEIKEYNALA